jgi:hypothetical protein
MFLHCCYRNLFHLAITLSLINIILAQSNVAENECSNYCSNGGVCFKSDGGPKCACLSTWTGERCDISQAGSLIDTLRASQVGNINLRDQRCTFVPANFCNNRGTCFYDDVKKSLACKCVYPYAGDYCDEISGMYRLVSILVFLIKISILRSILLYQ